MVEKLACWRLYPTVFTFAMLSEIAASAEELAIRPETPACIALLMLMARFRS